MYTISPNHHSHFHRLLKTRQAVPSAITHLPFISFHSLSLSLSSFFLHHILHFYLEETNITNLRGLRWSSATRPIPAAQYSLAIHQTVPAHSRRRKPFTPSSPRANGSRNVKVSVWIAGGRCMHSFPFITLNRSLPSRSADVR